MHAWTILREEILFQIDEPPDGLRNSPVHDDALAAARAVGIRDEELAVVIGRLGGAFAAHLAAPEVLRAALESFDGSFLVDWSEYIESDP